MASVFKTKDRRGKLHAVWRFKYRGVDGKWKYGTGWPDKKKTLEHALSVEAECRAIRKGEKAAPAAWLKNRNKPIKDIVEDYLKWGRTQGGRYGKPWSKKNARQKELDLAWWVKELRLSLLTEINLHRVEDVLQGLLAAGAAPKSVALKVESLRCVCVWSIRRGFLPENPLRGLARFDTRPKMPHRALTEAEVGALIQEAASNRRIWYETAIETGYRVAELRALRVSNLDTFSSFLSLGGDYTKNRKDARQPITRELATKLASLAQNKRPNMPLLSIPCKSEAAAHIKKDFKKAGVPLKTPQGKATWHSLRKVFVNNVVRSGADVKTVMELARHSAATMSLDVYASAKPSLLRSAIENAAGYMKEKMKETVCCTDVKHVRLGTTGDIATSTTDPALELTCISQDFI